MINMLPYLVFLRATLPYLGKEIERMREKKTSSTSKDTIWYILIFAICTPEIKKTLPWFRTNRYLCLLLTEPNHSLISRPAIFPLL